MNKTIKYSILIVLLFTLLLPTSATAATSQQPVITLDGRIFHTPDGEPAPYINNDKRTMGSLRLVGQALGVENKHIQWDNANQTATLARGSNKVQVTIGKKNILVNGKSVTMDTVAEMKQGRVFIPVRFIAQGLGVTIQYNSANGYLNLYTKKMEDVSMDNFEDYGMK